MAKDPAKKSGSTTASSSTSKADRFYGAREADRLRIAAGEEPTGKPLRPGDELPKA